MFNYVVRMLIPFYELCGPSRGVSSGNWSRRLQLAEIQGGWRLNLWWNRREQVVFFLSVFLRLHPHAFFPPKFPTEFLFCIRIVLRGFPGLPPLRLECFFPHQVLPNTIWKKQQLEFRKIGMSWLPPLQAGLEFCLKQVAELHYICVHVYVPI